MQNTFFNTAETYFLVKKVSNTRKMLCPHSKQIQFLGRNCDSVGGKCTLYTVHLQYTALSLIYNLYKKDQKIYFHHKNSSFQKGFYLYITLFYLFKISNVLCECLQERNCILNKILLYYYIFLASGGGSPLYLEFLQNNTKIPHRTRITVGHVGLEPGTIASEVWCTTNEPSHREK